MKDKYFSKKIIFFILALWFCFPNNECWAITRFSQFTLEKKIPVDFSLEEFWFMEKGEKVIADISLNWITVVFNPALPSGNTFINEPREPSEVFISEKARDLINRYPDLVDYLHDKNLAEDACFFSLKAGMTITQLKQLITDLNQEEVIYFVHPALIFNNRTYAFFNLLNIKWKSSSDLTRRDRILQQACITFDESENIYRVNLFEIPFFTALHLLEEDISVLEATPYLVEIKPSIEVNLNLPINGANIGEPIPFIITINFSDRVSIDPSSVSNISLRPTNLQRELFDVSFDPYDPAEVVRQSPGKITGKITCFASGEFFLPPININYTCIECSDNTPRSIATKPVPLKISSIVPSTREVNRLLIPLDPISPNYRFEEIRKEKGKMLITALFTLIVFFICLGYLIVSVQRERKKRGELIDRSKEEILKEKIQVLLSTTPAIPHWKYMSEVGSLLREYLLARLPEPIPQSQGGTGKIFIEIIGNHLDPNLRESLLNLLELIDNAVALEITNYPDLEKFRKNLKELLNISSS